MERKALEDFHRKTLRQIQNLPPRVAIPSIFILIGALLVEAEIDKRNLALFGSIARDQSTKVAKIAFRQLIMKSQTSNSWFVELTRIMYKYGLPSPLDVLADPPSKASWKTLAHKVVNYYWCTKLCAEARRKSTLAALSTVNMQGSNPSPHPLWASVQSCPRDIQRGAYQAKMLTGTYTLQSHRYIYSKGAEGATCPLCKSSEHETVVHFLGACSNTQDIRDWFITEAKLPEDTKPETIAQIALDSTPYVHSLQGDDIHFLARLFCFRMHYHRAFTLDRKSVV
jgi:hypothetical protein